MTKLNWRGELVEDDEDLVVGGWVVNDGFSANYAYMGVNDEVRLRPEWRQYVSWKPSLVGAESSGRCCTYKKVYSRDDFLALIAELPEGAEIEYRESDGYGSSWSFCTYRSLTEEERAIVRAKKEAVDAKQAASDREAFNKLLERHPEWASKSE